MWSMKTEQIPLKSMFKRFDVGGITTIVNLAQITYMDRRGVILTFYNNNSRFSVTFEDESKAKSVFNELWEYVK